MTVDMTTMTTAAARKNDHNVLFQRELKEDWDDFESPTTKSIEMLEDSGHLVNVEEDPVLITPSPSGDDVKTTTKQHRQESTKSMTPIREDTAEEVDHPSTTTTIERPATTASSEDFPTNRSNDKPQFVSPKDFELLKVIGMGAFGKVVQVRNKKSQKVLAMKVISKRLLRRKSSYIKQMQLERDVLKKVRHPFIVTMHCSFQAKEKLFIVMDFLAGGELFERLGKEGIFLESQACFYLAEIILALEHLHSHNILHRDLKPENILLGSDGHVCLTDFGLAKDFSIEQGYWSELPEEEKKETETDDGNGKETSSDSNNNTAETKASANDTEDDEPVHRARTICGTTEYMAPEMIARKGYGKAADFWSLGCVAYEMLSGNTPFTSRKGEKDLMRKILCERIKMPPMITSDAVKLLKGLLNRNPQDRLGNSKGNMFHVGGVTGLKQMPFFETIQWTKLEQKEMDPPAKFAVQHESDTQYFHEEFLKMNLPRSITEMSNDKYQPRRCASDQFKGFSFIQQDFDLPERNDSELDLYWNGTADPDCDSISECASGIFGDNDDLSVGNNTTNSVVDKIPPSASTSAKKKKKKKNKATATTTATTATATTDSTPTTGDIVKPTPQSQQPNTTSDNEQQPQEQKTSVEARPSNVDVKIAVPVTKPNIPTVPSTHSLSSASGTSSILSTTKLSRVASIQQQQQEQDQDPQTPGGQDGGRRQLLVSAALTPSRGSYVPPHLRATSSGSFSSLGTSATKSPGSSSQYKKGPTYLASPNIYARSNVALHGTKSSAVAVNHATSTTTKISTTQHPQQLVLPSGLPTLPIVAGGATTTNKKPSTNAWATVTSSKKGGGGNNNNNNSGTGAAASIPSLKPRTTTTSASSATTAKVGGVGGSASSSSTAWHNPSSNRKTPGISTGGWSQSQPQPQSQQRQIPSVSSASAATKASKPSSTGTWGKPSATLAAAPAPAPPPPNVVNNPNDFPSWPTLGGGQDTKKGSSIPSKAATSSSTPAKKPPAGVWGISSSSSSSSAKKKSTTTPSPWKQAR